MLTIERTRTTTPVLKWAGGKRWLVPTLANYWKGHEHRRFVEPFAGGLAVALGLAPTRALVNDVNPHVMNFYRQVQRGLPWLDFLQFSNDRITYLATRDWFNQLVLKEGGKDTDTAAWLFYYLNRTGFNGLCRFNSKGGFNVPFGQYKTINYRQSFPELEAALKGWQIACADFATLAIEPDDFLYLDPPYDTAPVTGKRQKSFTAYSAGGFGWDDQVRFAEWAALHPGPTLISNLATDRICDLYNDHGFELELLSGPRRISCTGDRAAVQEVLARRHI